MKKLQIGSILLTVVCLAVFVVWRIAGTLPDWVARLAGIGTAIGIVTVSFSTVGVHKKETQDKQTP